MLKQPYSRKIFNPNTVSTLTIASGVVVPTQHLHMIDTESSAASDDLVTITNTNSIAWIVIRPANDARTIVVKHNTGNIWLQNGTDVTLDDLEDGILLYWDSITSKWFDIVSGGALDDTAGGTDALTTKAPTSNAFYDVSHALPNRNAIINGSMRVSQRGTSFTSATTPANSDDTYLLDRWILLSDGNDIVDVSQVARTVPNGSSHEIKLEVETANKQFGICTILENKDSARFIGQTCSLSFKARMAAADDNTHSVVAAILSWHSTADTVTSDVVNTWAAPITSWTAEWAVEGETTSQTLTTTEQTFKLEGVAIDNDTTNTKNIAVIIYCDQTNGAVDDAIIITDVQLELGSVATPFEFRPYGQELALCQRYYERITAYGGNSVMGFGYMHSSSVMRVYFNYTQKRTVPTITTSAMTTFSVFMNGTYDADGLASITGSFISYDRTGLIVTSNGATYVVGQAGMIGDSAGATRAYIELTGAEL